MNDILYILFVLLFFVITFGLIDGLNRLKE